MWTWVQFWPNWAKTLPFEATTQGCMPPSIFFCLQKTLLMRRDWPNISGREREREKIRAGWVINLWSESREEGSTLHRIKRLPGGGLEQTTVNVQDARTSKAAIVAQPDLAESIWLPSWLSFPVFSLEESAGREKPLPRRRLRAPRCYLLSHRHAHANTQCLPAVRRAACSTAHAGDTRVFLYPRLGIRVTPPCKVYWWMQWIRSFRRLAQSRAWRLT